MRPKSDTDARAAFYSGDEPVADGLIFAGRFADDGTNGNRV